MLHTKIALLLVLAGAAADKCPQYQDCHDCLNPKDPALNCGWCSPDPAVNADGSKATQCMDHTSKGWACFHLYMHDGCVAGYVCNHTVGQCQLGAPGTGDTKENCMISCHPPAPPPPPQYHCNITSLKCELSPEGHTDKAGCSSACSNSTPSAMVGLWRGLDVQKHFTLGEYVANFSESTVAWGPLATPRMYEAAVATLSRTLMRFTLTAPASMAGEVQYVTYSTPGWPTGPETLAISLALQKVGSHQAPPQNTADAMGNVDFEVYVMNKCDSWKKECSFAAAFKPAAALADKSVESVEAFSNLLLGGPSGDKCTVHSSCDTCIDDPLKVCGWCDGIITFGDGTTCGADGKGCCGGASGFSKCNLAYRKECPVVCDWTNWTKPFCRAATSKEIKSKTQTFEDCDTIKSWCKYTFGHYCNRTDEKNPQCVSVESKEECEKTPGCDPNNPNCGSNCTPPTPTQYFYCDTKGGMGCKGPFTKEECAKNPECKKETSCDPTVCKAEVSYVCDPHSFQCSQVTGKPSGPHYNTSKECSDACYDHDVSGVWRGIRIDSGFVADEWDFVFSEAAKGATVTYKSKKTGKTYDGKYTIGNALTTDGVSSFQMTVTLSTGEVLTGLFDNKDKGPITKFMYLGLPLKDGDHAASYEDAMAASKQEFVLIACLPQIAGCDFDGAAPTALALK